MTPLPYLRHITRADGKIAERLALLAHARIVCEGLARIHKGTFRVTPNQNLIVSEPGNSGFVIARLTLQSIPKCPAGQNANAYE